MNKRNLRTLFLSLAILVIASGGLIMALRDSGGEAIPDGQRVLSPEEKPTISAPGVNLPGPEPRDDPSKS